jgi:hypothetical protein
MISALVAESLAQAGRAEPLVRAASYCQVAAHAAWAAPAGREQRPRTQGKWLIRCIAARSLATLFLLLLLLLLLLRCWRQLLCFNRSVCGPCSC